MRALICGISGQDGAYLARFLLEKGYEVWGSSRDAQLNPFSNLERLGIKKNVNLISIAPTDFRSVLKGIEVSSPDEIYNLSGQSSVGLSFDQPVETLESAVLGTLNFLESIRFFKSRVKFYNAASSEVFGNTETPANENTPFNPCSPYGIAKATAFWTVKNYREAYNLFACSGILFNHESPLRPARFVTQKIVSTAQKIASGSSTKLELGNIEIVRDWGWAEDYVRAMWLILQQPNPQDFVIATGESHSLKEFIHHVFSCHGLNWKNYVEVKPELFRPNELLKGAADPKNANRLLGWKPNKCFNEIIEEMVSAGKDFFK
ncbi:MAG: GDP-mannose 4,6-dehydratase [Candidatus Riflebacteria bacterium]